MCAFWLCNYKEIHIIMLCVHLSFVFVVLRIENATPSEVRPTIPLTAQMPEGILFVEMMDINRQIYWNVEINRSRQDNATPTYKYFQIVVCVCFSADQNKFFDNKCDLNCKYFVCMLVFEHACRQVKTLHVWLEFMAA